MRAVCLGHIVGYDGIVARAWCRRKLQTQVRSVHLVHLYPLYFSQLLDAALYLYGLGSLVAEAFDKLLGVGYLLLLVLIGAHLLLYPLLM